MSERTFLDLSGSPEAAEYVVSVADSMGLKVKALAAPSQFNGIGALLRQHRPAFVLMQPDVTFLSRSMGIRHAWFPPVLAYIRGTPTPDTIEDLRQRGVSAILTPRSGEQERERFGQLCNAPDWLKVRLNQMHLSQILQSLDAVGSFLVTAATPRMPAVSTENWDAPTGQAWYGRVYVEDGLIVHSETPGRMGQDALAQMLELEDGFAVVHKVALPAQAGDMRSSIQGALISAAVSEDHKSRMPPRPAQGGVIALAEPPDKTQPGVAPPPDSSVQSPPSSSKAPRPSPVKPGSRPGPGGPRRPAPPASALPAGGPARTVPRPHDSYPDEELEPVVDPGVAAHTVGKMKGIAGRKVAPSQVASSQFEPPRAPRSAGAASAGDDFELASESEPIPLTSSGGGVGASAPSRDEMLAKLVHSEEALVSAAACNQDGWLEGLHGHMDGETQGAAAAMGFRHVRAAGQLLGLGEPSGFCVSNSDQANYVAGASESLVVARGTLRTKPTAVLDKMRAFIENQKSKSG